MPNKCPVPTSSGFCNGKHPNWLLTLVTVTVLAGIHSLSAYAQSEANKKITIAVAANFLNTAKAIRQHPLAPHAQQWQFASASSGKLFHQIQNGAPFDLFFAANQGVEDQLRQTRPKTKSKIYAIGKLALWAPGFKLRHTTANGFLKSLTKSGQCLIMANPRHAPYGMAAAQYLKAQGFYEQLQPQLVLADNISMAYASVDRQDCSVGLVALSHLIAQKAYPHEFIPLSSSTEPRIVQSLILLRSTAETRRVFNFIFSPSAQKIIREHGYDLP